MGQFLLRAFSSLGATLITEYLSTTPTNAAATIFAKLGKIEIKFQKPESTVSDKETHEFESNINPITVFQENEVFVSRSFVE